MNSTSPRGAVLLYAAAGLFMVFALLDGFTPQILPFHEKMLGMTHEQLPAPIAEFSLFLLRIIGGCLFAIAATLVFLIRGPFRNREPWARTAIGILVLTSTVSLSGVMLSHSVYSPWPAPLLGLILTLVAFYISRNDFTIQA